MNRDQVFLAVLSGVVARGPQFKRREAGGCGPLEVNYERMIKITNNVTDAVMRSVDPAEHRKDVCYSDLIQSNRDLENESIQHRNIATKLQRELTESRTNFGEAYRKIEAKEFKILELEDEIKRLDRELKESNQAVAAAGTRPTWHHLREVEKDLQDAKIGLKAVSEIVMERDATIGKLQADKDALRKAVEDGAMEIERLRNTLKGVEQIAQMKPEDVEALKAAWDKIEKDGGLITMKWSNDAMAMIHQDESRPVPQTFRPLPQSEIKTPAAKWIEITDGRHVLEEGDYCIPVDEFISVDDDHGWLPVRVCDLEHVLVGDLDTDYRFRRAAESQS